MNGYDDAAGDGAPRARARDAARASRGRRPCRPPRVCRCRPTSTWKGFASRATTPPTDQETPVDTVAVGADYFAVVGVPIVAGRAFTQDDIAQQRRVAIVNETLARQYWPDGNAVGQQILHRQRRVDAVGNRRRRARPQGAIGRRGPARRISTCPTPRANRSASWSGPPRRRRRRCRCCARRSGRSSPTSCSPKTCRPRKSRRRRLRRRGSAPWCSARSACSRWASPRSVCTASSPIR